MLLINPSICFCSCVGLCRTGNLYTHHLRAALLSTGSSFLSRRNLGNLSSVFCWCSAFTCTCLLVVALFPFLSSSIVCHCYLLSALVLTPAISRLSASLNECYSSSISTSSMNCFAWKATFSFLSTLRVVQVFTLSMNRLSTSIYNVGIPSNSCSLLFVI